jgi:phosphonate transport system ATP-binding protein
VLRVEQLHQVFAGNVVALDGVSFALEPGSFTAVLGPSGAGKTTLLRSILRLVPSKGQVWVDGEDLTAASPARLREMRGQIALIGQQFPLVRRQTALVNTLAGRLREVPLWRCVLSWYPDALLAEGLSSLARVGLLDHAFRRADHLSGGQQQRVAVARALTQRARLVLADEPVSSLDPESAGLVLELFRSLCHDGGLTVLCNLHQVELARTFADRVLGLHAGRVVFDGSAASLDAEAVRRIYCST